MINIKKLFSQLLFSPKWRYNLHIFRKMNAFCGQEWIIYSAMLFNKACLVGGDYYEFGCYKGSSLMAAYYLANSTLDYQMHFNVFDSFKGLPTPSKMDNNERYKEGRWSCDSTSFVNIIVKNGLDLKHITIWPGFYNESLDAKARKQFTTKASVIFIDCDIYESTCDALNFMTTLVQEGTVIIFDDYFLHHGKLDRGVAMAFSQWLHKNQNIKVTEYLRTSNGINSFIVNTV